MKFETITPILYSSDIEKSIRYYVDQLAFDGKWMWDEPPTFGGVNMGDIHIFFCKDGQGNPGTWIAIKVDNVDEYYELIKARGAKIVDPPTDHEWFLREMLVQDPDGHMIRFGHSINCD
ncbi:MAG: glyoxalase superfamily protein [Bacteroidota bacterium]